METRARGRESEGTRCCVASGGSIDDHSGTAMFAQFSNLNGR